MPATIPLHQFEASVGGFAVDPDKGIIKGISLITAGISARGHKVDHPEDEAKPEDKRRKVSLEIDETTLEQMLACAEARGKLPVKWNHKTGADAVSGYIKNFRIEGKKLKGDWHLLKSHERYGHALELAQEMPESLGLSVSFAGKDETKGQRKFARCTDLVSADLVASPAANPDGMFSVPVDSGGDDMAKPIAAPANPAADPTKEFSLADVMAGITQLNTRFGQAEERLDTIEQFNAEFEEAARHFEEGEDPDAEENEGEPTGFASVGDALRHLESRLEAIQDEKEREASEAALSEFEEQVNGLIETNEQLALENAALAAAVKELSTMTGHTVSFKAGAEGYVHEFAAPREGRHSTTAFEARVDELVRSGKCADEADATMFAVEENQDRYARHLEEIGAGHVL
jgi:hypothetical protein